jgi:hypothetical protein
VRIPIRRRILQATRDDALEVRRHAGTWEERKSPSGCTAGLAFDAAEWLIKTPKLYWADVAYSLVLSGD